jgi:hypothetical protein
MSRAAIMSTAGAPAPHLVKPEDREEAARFLKGLVEATDRALESD